MGTLCTTWEHWVPQTSAVCNMWALCATREHCVPHGRTVYHMGTLSATWEHWVPHGNTECHKRALCADWDHCVSHGRNVCHMGALCATWDHCVLHGALCTTWEYRVPHGSTVWHMGALVNSPNRYYSTCWVNLPTFIFPYLDTITGRSYRRSLCGQFTEQWRQHQKVSYKTEHLSIKDNHNYIHYCIGNWRRWFRHGLYVIRLVLYTRG